MTQGLLMRLKNTRLVLNKNEKGNDYVVGDIHGYVTQLRDQLNDLGFDTEVDRLICVGDLIDRGPESIEALDLLDEPWFYAVLGNHEYLMVSGMKYQVSKDRMIWLNNGGDWIMKTDPSYWHDWFDRIEAMPICIEIAASDEKRIGIIHADFPGESWNEFDSFDEHDLYRCIWSRSNFNSRSKHSVRDIDTIYHGHCVSEGELVLGNRRYIEQGAFLGNEFIIRQL